MGAFEKVGEVALYAVGCLLGGVGKAGGQRWVRGVISEAAAAVLNSEETL